MIITRKHLPRRTFLRGLGAIVALPMLDAMTPGARARRQRPRARPVRLAFTYVPNGVTMADWTPTGDGPGLRVHAHPQAARAVPRGHARALRARRTTTRYALGDGPGDHARAAACYLTGVHPRKTAGADIQNGISVDQIAAQPARVGDTRFPSLELGCEDSRTVGNCDSGYSCAYTNSLAWRSADDADAARDQPAARCSSGCSAADAGLDPADAARSGSRTRRSILDLVGERTPRAAGRPRRRRTAARSTSTSTSVREIERRIESAEQRHAASFAPDMEKPTGIPGELRGLRQADVRPAGRRLPGRPHARRHHDDRTRGEHCGRIPEIGVPDPHHPLTHHREQPGVDREGHADQRASHGAVRRTSSRS